MTQVETNAAVAQGIWKRARFQNLIMNDRLTLIDESANFAVKPFVVRDGLKDRTHYVGEVEFHLLAFFCEPRTREEVEAHFEHDLPGELSSPDLVTADLDYYMEILLSVGFLKDGGPIHDKIRSAGKDGAIVFRAPPIQHHQKTVQSFPKTIGINLTERCNLACLHCSVGSNPSVSTKNDLTTEELHRLFDEFDACGLRNLRLTGGEPMMRPDFWEVLEDATNDRRFSVTLFTNGTRLNEEGVDRLRAIRDRMGDQFLIHISLDGGTAESHDFLRNRAGNFARVVKTMEMLQAKGLKFYIESVLHERSASVENLDAMCEVVAPLGVTYVTVHPGEMIGTGEGEQSIFLTREFLVEFERQLQPIVEKWAARGLEISFSSYTFPLDEPSVEHAQARDQEQRRHNGESSIYRPVVADPEAEDPAKDLRGKIEASRDPGFDVCTAGISQAAIGADGNVYGCPRYVGAKPFSMGNVRDRSLLSIWGSPGWDFLREDYQPKLKLCNDCAYFDNCFYGKTCRANPGYLFNDAYGVSPECILEYDRLQLPYEKVKAYLEERKAENPGNSQIQLLCDRLLRTIAAKHERLCAN